MKRKLVIRSKKTKVAQASFFILVAVVLMFFFGFTGYVYTSAKQRINKEIKTKQTIETVKRDVLSVYVKRCADLALRQAIVKYLGNAFFPNATITYNGKNYSVTFFEFNHKRYFAVIDDFQKWQVNGKQYIFFPPKWPFNQEYADDYYLTYRPLLFNQLPPYSLRPFIYGIPNYFFISLINPENLTTLEKRSAILLPLQYRIPLYSVLFDSKIKNLTIKSFMERDIEKSIRDCLNLDALRSLTGADYKIQSIKAGLKFMETKTNLIVKVDYLKKYFVQNSKYTNENIMIGLSVNYPFLKIYQELERMFRKDLYDITFNLKKALFDFASKYDFKLMWNKVGNVFYYTLKSNQQILPEIYPEIRFSIVNRPPVLYPIGGNLNYSSYLFNYIVKIDEPVVVKPIAIDPDEDYLNYIYSGWRTDNYYNVRYRFLPSSKNEWQESSYYKAKCKLDPSLSYLSSLVPSIRRCANVFANARDSMHIFQGILGWNRFTVTAKEIDSNWQDFRDVDVLVYAEPFNVVGLNQYSDVPNSWASVEDLYTLKFSGGSLFASDGIIEICVDNGTFKYCKNTTLAIEQTLPLSFLYRNIVNNSGTKKDLFNNSVLGNSRLIVSIYSGSDKTARELNITIKQCLPHHSSIPPFPFNRLFGYTDDYDADHACCNPDGTINTTKTCFQHTFSVCGYDSDQTFLEKKGLKHYIVGLKQYPGKPSNPLDYIYHIYNVSVITYCGERGNLCNGDYFESWTLAQNFADLTNDYDELCVGCVNGTLQPMPHDQTYEYWLNHTLGFNLGFKPTNFCKLNYPINDLSLDDIKNRKDEIHYNGILIEKDVYGYLCNVSCKNGKCGKIIASNCVDSYTMDDINWRTLQMTDYYFNKTGALLSHTIDLNCSNYVLGNKNYLLPDGSVMLITNGALTVGDLCYVAQNINPSMQSILKQYPQINNNVLNYTICNRAKVIDCARLFTIKVNAEGIDGNASLITYKASTSTCKFGCDALADYNCCEKIEKICDKNRIGTSYYDYNKGITYYCIFDPIKNSYNWSTSKPIEFCLDNIDNDLDGLKDAEDPDCEKHLCFNSTLNMFGIILNHHCYTKGFIQAKPTTYDYNYQYVDDVSSLQKYLFTFNLSEFDAKIKSSYFILSLNDLLNADDFVKRELNNFVIANNNLTSAIWDGKKIYKLQNSASGRVACFDNYGYGKECDDLDACVINSDYQRILKSYRQPNFNHLKSEFKIFSSKTGLCQNDVCYNLTTGSSDLCGFGKLCYANYDALMNHRLTLFNFDGFCCKEPYIVKDISYSCKSEPEDAKLCYYYNGSAIEVGLGLKSTGHCYYDKLYYDETSHQWKQGLQKNAQCKIFKPTIKEVNDIGLSNGMECCNNIDHMGVVFKVKDPTKFDLSKSNLDVDSCINTLPQNKLVSVDFDFEHLKFSSSLGLKDYFCINFTPEMQWPVQCREGMLCYRLQGDFKKENIGIYHDGSCIQKKHFIADSGFYPFRIFAVFDEIKEEYDPSEDVLRSDNRLLFKLEDIQNVLYKNSITLSDLLSFGDHIRYYDSLGFVCNKNVISDKSLIEFNEGKSLIFKCEENVDDYHMCYVYDSTIHKIVQGVTKDNKCNIWNEDKCFILSFSIPPIKMKSCDDLSDAEKSNVLLCFSHLNHNLGQYFADICFPATNIFWLTYNCNKNTLQCFVSSFTNKCTSEMCVFVKRLPFISLSSTARFKDIYLFITNSTHYEIFEAESYTNKFNPICGNDVKIRYLKNVVLAWTIPNIDSFHYTCEFNKKYRYSIPGTNDGKMIVLTE